MRLPQPRTVLNGSLVFRVCPHAGRTDRSMSSFACRGPSLPSQRHSRGRPVSNRGTLQQPCPVDRSRGKQCRQRVRSLGFIFSIRLLILYLRVKTPSDLSKHAFSPLIVVGKWGALVRPVRGHRCPSTGSNLASQTTNRVNSAGMRISSHGELPRMRYLLNLGRLLRYRSDVGRATFARHRPHPQGMLCARLVSPGTRVPLFVVAMV